MKPRSIEERKAADKRAAIHGAVFFAVMQVACAVCFESVCFIPDVSPWLMIVFGGLAALCLLLIIPVFVVLKERFKEIEGGELDVAGQY